MESIKKFINVMGANLGLTIVLFAAIILFAVFSDGLLAGLITALSALIAYTCCELLYREYRASSTHVARSANTAKATKRSGKKSK
ncbi:MAG: hypothetical protein J6W41_03675 [Alphaproteobacteria bacterium]|nr:hypothetical protein [Alphaproteobacteria bacterium]